MKKKTEGAKTMKATYKGIVMEGSPEEIAKLKRLIDEWNENLQRPFVPWHTGYSAGNFKGFTTSSTTNVLPAAKGTTSYNRSYNQWVE